MTAAESDTDYGGGAILSLLSDAVQNTSSHDKQPYHHDRIVTHADHRRIFVLKQTHLKRADHCKAEKRQSYSRRKPHACRARHMLEVASPPTTTIAEASVAAGFADTSHFSTAFRRTFSMRPTDVLKNRHRST